MKWFLFLSECLALVTHNFPQTYKWEKMIVRVIWKQWLFPSDQKGQGSWFQWSRDAHMHSCLCVLLEMDLKMASHIYPPSPSPGRRRHGDTHSLREPDFLGGTETAEQRVCGREEGEGGRHHHRTGTERLPKYKGESDSKLDRYQRRCRKGKMRRGIGWT